jgi:hypothetical protein
MPLWFPFALLSSFLIMMGSGARTGFRTPADLAEEEERRKRLAAGGAPPPKVQGLLQSPKKVTKGNWPYKGLPHRVTLAGKLFEKGRSFKSVPGIPVKPHAVYNQLGGHGRLIVLETGRFVAQV